jgi:hypothetical protein
LNAVGYIALGAGLGLLVGLALRGSESYCCGVVAGAVRDKVGDKLGSTAQAAGDLFNLWGVTPALLQTAGYRP